MPVVTTSGAVIDSRDLIETLTDLRERRDDDEIAATDPLDDDEIGLLAELEEIEGEAPTDWIYGETFIRADYFEEYARQLADDIGAIDADAGWPLSFIDWPAAAEALKQDYTEYTLFGDTFYARA